MQELGSETILQILPYGSSSTSSLQSVLQLVKNSSNNLAGYKDAYRFEYTKEINDLDEMNQQLSSAIENLVQQGANPSLANYAKYGYYYKPNQTKNLYTNLYNTELAGVGVECNLSSLEQQSTQSQFEPSRVIFEENAIGQMLYAITGLGEGGVLTTECQNDLVANIAQIELALKGYKLDNGSLPASLDSLTPQYLTSVPLDPFDQQPVSYSAGKKILYSVGINKQDLGGSQGINWMQMDNPTFQINF
jgi:hypothetical protein